MIMMRWVGLITTTLGVCGLYTSHGPTWVNCTFLFVGCILFLICEVWGQIQLKRNIDEINSKIFTLSCKTSLSDVYKEFNESISKYRAENDLEDDGE